MAYFVLIFGALIGCLCGASIVNMVIAQKEKHEMRELEGGEE